MEYEKEAQAFLDKTNVEFKAEYIKTGLHFDGDKEERDIYRITLSRGDYSKSFDFGQSIVNSGRFHLVRKGNMGETILEITHKTIFMSKRLKNIHWKKNKNFAAPKAYDVLACLTKYEVGTFEDFCGDFGYEQFADDGQEHRGHKATWEAVLNEYHVVRRLWTEEEIEELQEIN